MVPALTIILKSRGCGWNRCLMCGYRHFRYPREDASYGDFLRGQVDWTEERFAGQEFGLVKIFTSGSFLDPREVPPPVREELLARFRGKEVIAETRPEYVTGDAVASCLSALDAGSGSVSFSVAMGLETSDDGIREKCIDKGFTFGDFVEASRTARIRLQLKGRLWGYETVAGRSSVRLILKRAREGLLKLARNHVIAGGVPQTLQWGLRSTVMCWKVMSVPEKSLSIEPTMPTINSL